MAKDRYFYLGGVGALLFYVAVFVSFMYLIVQKNKEKDEETTVSISLNDLSEVVPVTPAQTQPAFKPLQQPSPPPPAPHAQEKTPLSPIKPIELKSSTPLNIGNVGVKSLTLPTPVTPVKLNKPVPKNDEKNTTQVSQKVKPLSVKMNLAKATPLQLNQGKASSAQLAKLSSMIYEQWTPAAGEEGLMAKIGIKSTPSGSIQVRLAGSSGDPKFDQKLMNIVNKLDYAILFPDKTAVDVVVSFKVKGE